MVDHARLIRPIGVATRRSTDVLAIEDRHIAAALRIIREHACEGLDFRVLKPGGVLIGSVAFLEPSHGTSFYHPSHVGICNLLQDAAFTVCHIAPFADWPALKALASMGLFFRMRRAIAQALVAPLQLFHMLWWRLGALVTGHDLEKDRLNHFSGSFSFIASKER